VIVSIIKILDLVINNQYRIINKGTLLVLVIRVMIKGIGYRERVSRIWLS